MNTATEHAIHIRFGGRHTRRVIVIGVLATACLLALPGVLLAYGYWGWALLTAAGAVTNAVWLISPGDNALDPHRTVTADSPEFGPGRPCRALLLIPEFGVPDRGVRHKRSRSLASTPTSALACGWLGQDSAANDL